MVPKQHSLEQRIKHHQATAEQPPNYDRPPKLTPSLKL